MTFQEVIFIKVQSVKFFRGLDGSQNMDQAKSDWAGLRALVTNPLPEMANWPRTDSSPNGGHFCFLNWHDF